jgi:hypothetical protein
LEIGRPELFALTLADLDIGKPALFNLVEQRAPANAQATARLALPNEQCVGVVSHCPPSIRDRARRGAIAPNSTRRGPIAHLIEHFAIVALEAAIAGGVVVRRQAGDDNEGTFQTRPRGHLRFPE